MTSPAAQPPTDGRAGALPLALGLAVLAPLFLGGSEIASMLRYPEIGTAVFYPPYAVLTAALVLSRRRHWVWYILLAALAHFVAHWPQFPLSWLLMADVANTARALVAAALLLRLFGGPPRLDGLRPLALFVVSAVAIAPAVGASLGAAIVVLHGAAADFWRPWNAWFVSNALTGLIVLPATIAALDLLGRWRRLRIDRRRAAEAVGLACSLAAACAVAFALPGPYWPHLELLYAPLPVLVWAAMRFGCGGASAALAVVAYAAIWSVDRGTGPFVGAATDETIYSLQVFLTLSAVPVLCLAAIAAARRAVVELHRALLASLQDHVAILDSNGVILQVNDSWRRFAESADARPFQRAQEGDNLLEACALDARQGDATAACLHSGAQDVLVRERRRFDIDFDLDESPARRAFSTSVEALQHPAGGAVVTRSDVTARRQAQLVIEEQRRELSHLARVSVLGQLSGAFAHELNQPLTAILSNAEAGRRLLQRQPADLEEIAAILGDIADDDRRAAAVIQRLRALLERGDRRHQPVDGGELVGDVMELARAELLTRQVRAVAKVEPDLPPLLGDKVQLQQVLLNLVINACDAMGGSPPADRQLQLLASSDGDGNVRFAIADRGTGIAEEMMGRLFEPFVTTKPHGLGLGLSISRTIIAAHGGRLWAENNPGGGATLHCLLPTAARVADAASPATARPAAAVGK